ncbi:hypothetical protein CBR_g23053 [Chara braunii]|uniref:Endonuclease/exonuclease/phosphatase domain-containing protein n=1 Tax=Chara braunii TaxID=69332 RepID=A0A388L3G7_CHABU|nr:hypothetical protein CBR_g23053 [Chara braunii]|eukprot:GBG76837.1 hypothetical protein CBR_g23053 [Chara braunii]
MTPTGKRHRKRERERVLKGQQEVKKKCPLDRQRRKKAKVSSSSRQQSLKNVSGTRLRHLRFQKLSCSRWHWQAKGRSPTACSGGEIVRGEERRSTREGELSKEAGAVSGLEMAVARPLCVSFLTRGTCASGCLCAFSHYVGSAPHSGMGSTSVERGRGGGGGSGGEGRNMIGGGSGGGNMFQSESHYRLSSVVVLPSSDGRSASEGGGGEAQLGSMQEGGEGQWRGGSATHHQGHVTPKIGNHVTRERRTQMDMARGSGNGNNRIVTNQTAVINGNWVSSMGDAGGGDGYGRWGDGGGSAATNRCGQETGVPNRGGQISGSSGLAVSSPKRTTEYSSGQSLPPVESGYERQRYEPPSGIRYGGGSNPSTNGHESGNTESVSGGLLGQGLPRYMSFDRSTVSHSSDRRVGGTGGDGYGWVGNNGGAAGPAGVVGANTAICGGSCPAQSSGWYNGREAGRGGAEGHWAGGRHGGWGGGGEGEGRWVGRGGAWGGGGGGRYWGKGSRGWRDNSQGLQELQERTWSYRHSFVPPLKSQNDVADISLFAERGDSFVFMSYNILAGSLAEEHSRELYSRVHPDFLAWPNRRKNILKEMVFVQGDVVCLQEVDKFDELENELGKMGYQGTHRSRTGNHSDGCAVFWKTKKFKMQKTEVIEFIELGLRDNVAQLAVLESIAGRSGGRGKHEKASVEYVGNEEDDEEGDDCLLVTGLKVSARDVRSEDDLLIWSKGRKEGRGGEEPPEQQQRRRRRKRRKKIVVVGNIHVLFNPKRGDVKMAQIRTLIERARELASSFGNDVDVAVVLAGDFNCSPGSPLYQFISNAELDCSTVDRRVMSRVTQGMHGPNTAMNANSSGWQNSGRRHGPWSGAGGPYAYSTPSLPSSVAATLLQQRNGPALGGGEKLGKTLAPHSGPNVNRKSVFQSAWGELAKTDERGRQQDRTTVCPDTVIEIEDNLGVISPVSNGEKDNKSKGDDGGGEMNAQSVGKVEPPVVGVSDDDDDDDDCVIAGEKEKKGEVNGEGSKEPLVSQTASVLRGKPLVLVLKDDATPRKMEESLGERKDERKEERRDDFAYEWWEAVVRRKGDARGEGGGEGMVMMRGPPCPSGQMERRLGWEADDLKRAVGVSGEHIAKHGLSLISAYADVKGVEPPCTSYHEKFMGTVDYIWHTRHLEAVRVLDTVPPGVLRRLPGLPAANQGSDHMALACEFAFIDRLEWEENEVEGREGFPRSRGWWPKIGIV